MVSIWLNQIPIESTRPKVINPNLYISSSGKRGIGVFTKKAIPANTTIEISPVIVLPTKQVKSLLKTKMASYVFKWGESARKLGLALGYGSLYNHSYSSNCQYTSDFKKNLLVIKTRRKIEKNEELFVNYNHQWNDKTPVWFDVQ